MVKTELGEDTKIRVSLRSHTKVDTGGWFCDRPVWVSLTSDEILLTAAGKRPFFERILIQNCGSLIITQQLESLLFLRLNP